MSDADDVAEAFVVGLAALDEYPQTVAVLGQVPDVQSDQFAAPQCGGVADQQ